MFAVAMVVLADVVVVNVAEGAVVYVELVDVVVDVKLVIDVVVAVLVENRRCQMCVCRCGCQIRGGGR